MGGSVTDRSSWTFYKRMCFGGIMRSSRFEWKQQYIDYEKRGVFMKDVSISSLENMKLKELYELAFAWFRQSTFFYKTFRNFYR